MFSMHLTVRPRRFALPALGFLLLACLTLATRSPAVAATPESGTVSSTQRLASWTGGPFLALNPVVTTGCVADAPFCDTFALTIGQLDAADPDVAITLDGDQDMDVYYLTVYGPDGAEVDNSRGIGNTLKVILEDPAPGLYSVRAEIMLGVPTMSTFQGHAQVGDFTAPIDHEDACDIPVEDQTVLLTPDDGREVFLDVLVLLDGVEEEYATAFFEQVAVPYREINVTVRPTFQIDGSFSGTETLDLLAQLKNRFPRQEVPAAYDIVELLTAKDLTLIGETGIAGQADCLGGLAYDHRSFEVSEGRPPGFTEEGTPIGPLTIEAHIPAKITAHEMGHLLGGQHHYANCAEGNDPDEELSGDTSPCTLMFNLANLVSLDFSELNARIARGYAITYAAENDDAQIANRAPTARDDEATGHRNQSLVVDALANDGDLDGDPLEITGVGRPSHGSVRIVDGRLEYRPRSGFGGTDTFDYSISDGRGGTATATVLVHIGPGGGRP